MPNPGLDAADLWHEMGLYYYSDLADYGQALPCFVAADALRRKHLTDPAHNDLARSAFMMGVCHKYLGEYNTALNQVNIALKISSNGKNPFMLAKECLELGDIYDYLGDYDRSIVYYDRAYPHILNSQRDRVQLLEEHYNRLAQTYLAKEEYLLALQKNRSAIQVCLDSMKEEWADQFHAVIGGCFINMNLSFRAMQRYDSAHFCLTQALAYYQKSDLPYVTRHIGNIYNEFGELALAQNRYKDALQYQKKAITILQNYPQYRLLSSAYASAGEVCLQMGTINEAKTYFEKALKVAVPKFPASVMRLNTVTDKCLIALFGITRCQMAQKKFQEALHNFRRLDTLIIQLRYSLREDGSKFSLSQQALPIYEQAIRTALMLHDTSAALDFCERNKAIVLRQALTDQSAKQMANIDPTILALENRQLQRLVFWQKKVLEAENDSLRGVWQDSLATLKTAFEQQVQKLEKTQPDYFRLKYASIQAMRVVDIQRALPDSTLFVEYFMGNQECFVFAITRSECRIYTQVLQQGFLDSISLFIQHLQNPAPDATTMQVLSKTGFLCYQKILAPALKKLNTHGEIRRLRIVPDGLLHYLPFDALLEAPYPDLKGRNVPFLIKKFAISYSFSNQLLNNKKYVNAFGRTRWNFGGFGISYNQVNTSLTRLPLAEPQVEFLKKSLGGKTWTQSTGQSSKQHFLTEAPRCRILHLSMHGRIDEKQPAKSALMFVKNKSIEPLSALEIYGMRFRNNELTVLGACNTGKGVLQRGEGIMSVSRAFAYAGCRSLMMSLWELQDVYSDDIVKAFYVELKKGTPKDIALQRAKLQFLAKDAAEQRMPNYWAAMVIIGEVEALDFYPNRYIWLLIVLSLIIIGALFKFFNLGSKNKK
ncbi:MAG: CHAT domain-containing tetratricopeptide repeat protein [Haliscomenobacter sp.]|uniref:CHAT domain-containing protein n=1 Tax=Haliscomenobacter sp. TaxID=2717303 RepID=UPI0029AF70BE|nr:CHAT domain-containing tetratricopeptide repeat protein [Haliscomenobacter sp.]MDX2068423.1 CHAT domain-containing tetratricopeptide repeat protein [Haliscomenobacter sp.]